jgi:uncharacterized delta-60 repeat protein
VYYLCIANNIANNKINLIWGRLIMKAILTAILASLLITVYIFPQPFGQVWVSRYNGPGNNADWAYAMTLDNSGNILVTGYSNGLGTGKDLCTIKYGTDGQMIWQARYNGPINGGDYSFAVKTDANGNVYITGRSDRGPAFLSDYTTIKYNSSGVQQWVALFDGPSHNADEAKALLVDGAGNVYVTGKSYGTTSNYDIVTVKYNSNGVQQWVTTYNGVGNGEDRGNAIGIDNSGNIYVCGESLGAGFDFVLLKIDPNGIQSWSRTYNGPVSGGDGAVALSIDANNNIYVTGYSFGEVTSYDFATLKYDGAGNQLWLRRFNSLGNGFDVPSAMTLDMSGNVVITGASQGSSSPTSDSNFSSIKYDPNGNLLWAAFYAGPNFSQDVARAIVTDNNSNIYITGSSSNNGVTTDYVTIKYNPNGAQQWLFTYNGPDNSNDYTSSIAVNSSTGEVFVTGRSFSTTADYDFTTIKYGNLVGITHNGNTIPDKFNLYQNYPNPFNPETKIKFDIPENSGVQLAVYNAIGEAVFNKEIGNFSPGQYEYSLNASDLGLSSGIYFYKLTTAKYSGINKMVLVK